MPAPTGVKCELELIAGTWTDVTSDVDFNAGYTIHVGRTSPGDQPQPSSCTVTFNNPTGKYTPGVQVLSDGTTSPFYPNLTIRKRIRVSDSAGVQFVGGIKSIQPTTNGFTGSARSVIQALDLMDQLSRIKMSGAIRQEVLTDQPIAYWPLTEDAGSTQAAEQSGNGRGELDIVPSAIALTFGDNGPGAGDGTGVKFTPGSASTGQYLTGGFINYTFSSFSIECWVNPGINPPSWASSFGLETVLSVGGVGTIGNQAGALIISGTPWLVEWEDGSVSPSAAAPVADGGWHHLVVTRPVGSGTVSLYIDGALAASAVAVGGGGPTGPTSMTVGELTGFGNSRFQGNIGQVAIYPTILSPARIAAHFNAGMGWFGEATSDRITRFLSYAGITSTGIDTGSITVGTYPQIGKDIVSGCQDMAVSEGGGSAFYVLNGNPRFINRNYRKPAAPLLTIDVSLDADRGAFQPGSDDQSLANSSTASRATESGTQSQLTVIDQNSITTYGETDDDVTTYTTTDADAIALAQSIVAAGRTAGYRLPQISVDLLTAEHNLYAAVQSVQIGSRLRVIGLPAAAAPSSQLDVMAEGWTRTVNYTTNMVIFDTSQADTPAMALWGDAIYGKWAAQADCALNASITNSATTVVIASPTAPTFTTTPASYPFDVQVGAEVITLNTAPGGSTSPQTFTGVTRGAKGTTAGAHAAGATIQLWPCPTWTL